VATRSGSKQLCTLTTYLLTYLLAYSLSLSLSLFLSLTLRAVTQARVLFAEGNHAFRAKDYTNAKAAYSQALSVLQACCDRGGSSDSGGSGGGGDQGDAGETKAEPPRAQSLSGDPPMMASAALSNLGILSFAEGRYQDAKKLHAEALALRRTLDGKQEVSFGLDTLSAEIQKHFKCGQPGCTTSSVIARIERHERVDSATADSLNNLAAIYELGGNYIVAVKLYKEALALRRVLYGQNSLKTAESMSNLGSAYDSLGQLEEALPLMRAAVDVHCNLLGDNSPETSLLLNNLGVLLCHLGNFTESQSILERVVAIRTEAYGPGHFFTSCARQNLAYVTNRCRGTNAAATNASRSEATAGTVPVTNSTCITPSTMDGAASPSRVRHRHRNHFSRGVSRISPSGRREGGDARSRFSSRRKYERFFENSDGTGEAGVGCELRSEDNDHDIGSGTIKVTRTFSSPPCLA
jgi:tetratricopeptide (TPR) repeat protein